MGLAAFNRQRRLAAEQAAKEAEAQAKAKDSEEPKALADMTVPELKAYAKENAIDLGEATRKADVLAVIQAAESDDEGDE